MSIKYVAYGWDIKFVRATQREVYMALADHADHEGGGIRPGIPLIAYKVDMSERSVQRIILALEAYGRTDKLEDTGLLVREATGGGVDRGGANLWRIDISKAEWKKPFRDKGGIVQPRVPGNEPEGDTVSPGGDTAMSPGGDTQMSPDPSINPSMKKKGPSLTPSSSGEEDIEDEEIREEIGGKKSPVKLSALALRLKQFVPGSTSNSKMTFATLDRQIATTEGPTHCPNWQWLNNPTYKEWIEESLVFYEAALVKTVPNFRLEELINRLFSAAVYNQPSHGFRAFSAQKAREDKTAAVIQAGQDKQVETFAQVKGVPKRDYSEFADEVKRMAEDE